MLAHQFDRTKHDIPQMRSKYNEDAAPTKQSTPTGASPLVEREDEASSQSEEVEQADWEPSQAEKLEN